MPLKIGGLPATFVKGDYTAADIYKGSIHLGGTGKCSEEFLPHTFNHSCRGKADYTVLGTCLQAATPSPDAPSEIIPSQAVLMSHNGDNSLSSSVTLPELKAIPHPQGGWIKRDVLKSDGTLISNIRTVEFQGTESFYICSSIEHCFCVVLPEPPGDAVCMSNRFMNCPTLMSLPAKMTNGQLVINYNKVSGYIPGNILAVKLDSCNTAAEFKEVLQNWYSAGNPLTLWYIRETPLTQQVSADALLSYPKSTYVWLSSPGSCLPEAAVRVKTV